MKLKTYEILKNEKLFAFEIESIYISSRKMESILKANPLITITKKRAMFREGENLFEFSLSGESFVVWEPFGDSSRYWIGPKDEDLQPYEIKELETLFKSYKVPMLRRIFGDLVSFNFKSLVFGNKD